MLIVHLRSALVRETINIINLRLIKINYNNGRVIKTPIFTHIPIYSHHINIYGLHCIYVDVYFANCLSYNGKYCTDISQQTMPIVLNVEVKPTHIKYIFYTNIGRHSAGQQVINDSFRSHVRYYSRCYFSF